MKKLLFFVFILFLIPNVYALEYNMNSHTSATLGGTRNRYRSTEIYNTGTSHTYTFGTKYSGRISDIETYFQDYVFEGGTTYTLTYNMNTEDFRNNFGSSYWWDCSNGNENDMTNLNATVVSASYVSYKKVKLSFTPSQDTSCIRVWLRSKNLSSTAITGVSNWQLNNITLYDPFYQSGSSGGQGGTPTPTPTPNSYQDIINNQNNNTQDIINNQNNNTQDIINNANENTTKITDSIDNSLNFCVENLISGYYYVYSSGSTYNGITITTNSDKSITFSGTANSSGFVNILDIDESDRYFNSDILNQSSVCQDTGYCLNIPDDLGFGFSLNNGFVWLYTVSGTSINYTWYPMLTKSSSVPSIYIQPGQKYCDSKLDSNTQDIINNQNSNTDKQIESQKSCLKIGKQDIYTDNAFLTPDGNTFGPYNAFGISNYYNLNGILSIKTISPYIYNDNSAYCFYNNNKSLISCSKLYNSSILNIPQNALFFRTSFSKNFNTPIFELCFNGNQALTNSVNELNDTMKDDNVDDKTGFFTNFDYQDHGLTSIITAPLSTIQQLSNSACVSLSIPIPFTNSNVSLPCMTDVYQNYIPSVYNIWQIVSFGIISYLICLDIFHIVKGFKDPNSDKVEVLDL